MDLTVTDVPSAKRFEVRDGDSLAGFAVYIPTDEMIVFTHTEVPASYEGKGVGGTLVRGALDDVRARGLAVLPLCPFVKGWIQRHPDYADLVYSAPGSRVTD
ncbi:GNAT family N-acetyltransferase [Nocardiopsis mangrovi]|uniref:GNAT family N-acetyltransferase n=1 Tax=Nocardiopsis mangrovi TaxID=1179818 RepID=A0ABV9E4B2_9ACTN